MRISVLPAAALAAAAAVSAAPLTAQVPGLDNFSLERSQPPAPVVTPSPTPTATAPVPALTPSATPTPRPSASPSATATPSPRPTSSPTATATPTPTPSTSPTEAVESDEPEAMPSALPEPIVTPTPSATEVAPASTSATETGEQNWLWWLLGALALGAAVAAGWWWRGRREAAIVEDRWVEPEPEPTPVPVPVPAAPVAPPPTAAPPAPAPAPVPPPTPGGLITTALRPALDFALTPRQAGIDSLRATLDYILTVRNTGRAEAQAVELEAWLFSVGSDPTGVIDELTALPPGAPMVPPFAMPANSAFDLPSQGAVERTSLAVLTAGERKLFVPMLGVRARFYDVAGVARVAVAAFMIGVERAGQTRLAPLPLDRGARGFTGLAARRFEGR